MIVEMMDLRRPRAHGFADALHLLLACHDRFERVAARARMERAVGNGIEQDDPIRRGV
jgi:hypothetical protein